MADFARRIRRRLGDFRRAVSDELTAAGIIDAERKSRRTPLFAIGALGMAVGLALLALGVSIAQSSSATACMVATALGIGLLLSGIAGLIGGAMLSPWTDRGAVAVAQWRSFQRHLLRVALGRTPLPGPEEIQRMLPYAAGFGVAASLLRRRRKEGNIPVPPWFGALDLAEGADAYIGFLAYSDSSAAAAGGGGDGGAGGAGGGGASGGGSSGAG